MIKCKQGVVELEVSKEDLEYIFKVIPASEILKADSKGVLSKAVESTVYAADLRCILKMLIDCLGSSVGIEIISLAVAHITDDLIKDKEVGDK